MRILFLVLSYPESKEDSNIYSDLIDEFIANKHEVYVVAPGKGRNSTLKKESQVAVLRVKSLPLFSTSLIIKGISNLLLPYINRAAIKKHLSHNIFDVIIYPTPPITFQAILRYLKNKFKAKTYLILRDIFPQNAVDLKLMGKFLYLYFRRKEKKLYKISDYIGCMSQGNIDYLLKHNKNLERQKLHLLPNWISLRRNLEYNNDIREKHNLGDKIIAVFGGNLGKPQYVDLILNLAKIYIPIRNVLFFIIGNGTEKERISNRICTENINNIIQKDRIPQTEYLSLLKECDIGLVNLHPSFTIPNIPSRTLAYFQAKLPVLAAVDRATDFGNLIDTAQAGFWCYSDDINTYAECFNKLVENKDLRIKFGENGYRYLENYLLAKYAYQKIINELRF